MSESILSLFKKERPWANRSCRSLQKRIPLDFFKKSGVSDLLVIRANCSQKSESLPSFFPQLLFFKDRRDWFTLFSLQKSATVSKPLPLLFTKERSWTNRSRWSVKKSDRSNLLFFTSKPMIEFPTLRKSLFRLQLLYCIKNVYCNTLITASKSNAWKNIRISIILIFKIFLTLSVYK